MTEEQKQRLEQMRLASIAAVASVHVPIKLLTDKERARLAKVEAICKDGGNPYNHENREDKGAGSNALDRAIVYVPDDSEERRLRLEAKWKSGEGAPLRAYLPDDFSMLTTQKQLPIDPNVVLCSFCGTPVSRIMSTIGKGKPKRTIEERVVTDSLTGIQTIETKVRYSQSKMVSCPDCVMKLRNVEFPSEE